MSDQQIKDYLKKFAILTKEDLVKHIEQLKKNTNPNTKLISELVWVLEDFYFNFLPSEKRLNNHVSEVISKPFEERVKEDTDKCQVIEKPFFLDEVIEASEVSCKNTNSTRYKSSDGNFHPIEKIKVSSEQIKKLKVKENVEKYKNHLLNFKHPKKDLYDIIQIISCNDIVELENIDMELEEIFSIKEKTNPLVFPKNAEIHKEEDKLVKGIEGIKESNGKTDYSEIDWDIVDLMAKRFNNNKHKYPQGNMLKPIEEKELLFAGYRHLRKMLQPIDDDSESFLEHLIAVMCNMQMLYQQKKLKNSDKIKN